MMKVFLFFLLVFFTISCEMEIITKENANEYDLNFGDHEYGKAVAASLKRELDKAHIPYQVDDKNQIHYEEKYREVIESLITKVLTETPE